MKCTNCGTQLKEGARLCEQCGTPVDPRQVRRQSDDSYHRDKNNTPKHGGAHFREPRKKNNKASRIVLTALIATAAAAVCLFVLIKVFCVSDTELSDVQASFVRPAEAVQIHRSLDDPSNDSIKFKFDDSDRVLSCEYTADVIKYSQKYEYDDSSKKVIIKTSYRNRPIFTKVIEYSRVTEANRFEDIDGYYIRLGSDLLDVKPTQAPTEPTQPATAAPDMSDPKVYKDIYISFLKNTKTAFQSGRLLYLNNDNIPELILDSASSGPSYLCYLSGGSVQTFETAPARDIEYSKKGELFTTGYVKNGTKSWTLYRFNGKSVSEEHHGSVNNGNGNNKDNENDNAVENNGAYTLDDQPVSAQYYESFLEERKLNGSVDYCLKENMTGYIIDFK